MAESLPPFGKRIAHYLRSPHALRRDGLFVAQGIKTVETLLAANVLPKHLIRVENAWDPPHGITLKPELTLTVTPSQMARITNFPSPPSLIAIFEIPQQAPRLPLRGITLMLDRVQDPGNVGTIARTAAWFGVEQIIASTDSAEIYSPKGLQASAGAIADITLSYTNLTELLKHRPSDPPSTLYATAPHGQPLDRVEWENSPIILLGSEGQGISPDLHPYVDQWIGIPAAGPVHFDSLNIAAAAAIILAQAALKK